MSVTALNELERRAIGRCRAYEGADWSLIPGHMHGAMRRYIERGIDPGSFLYSVLIDSLSGAADHADHVNVHHLPGYASFLHSYAPSQAHGSAEKVRDWAASGGLIGQEQKREEEDHHANP